MLKKSKGIVLRNIKFGESSVISRIYTDELGVQSFIVNGVRKGKVAIKPSHLMPLTILEMVFYYKSTSSLHRLKELKCEPILQNLHFDVIKNSLTMFFTEIINLTIDEEEANPQLYKFLESFVHILDLEEGSLKHFPHFFMVHYSKYLGYFPRGNYTSEDVFDLVEGCYVHHPEIGNPYLDEKTTNYLWQLGSMSLDQLNTLFTSKETRANLLTGLVHYYELHMLHGRKIRSHIVIKEVLRDLPSSEQQPLG
jgi:DNA repair protein RecO (recombination protein O)